MTAPLDTADSDRSRTPDGYAEDFPEAVAEGVALVLGKPRARGWIHFYSAVVAVIAGAALVAVSWALDSTAAGLATLVYTATIVAMFAVSATYHRKYWKSETAHKWMKRADHSMIFIFIAGSYTPFAVLAMPPATGKLVLAIVWGGAVAGVALKMWWPSAPRWVGVPLYLLLGWVAIGFASTILQGAGADGDGAVGRGRRALQRGRGAVCAEVAGPLAGDVRPPRVLPCLHGGRGNLPLHRHLVRGVLIGVRRGSRVGLVEPIGHFDTELDSESEINTVKCCQYAQSAIAARCCAGSTAVCARYRASSSA